MVFDQLSAPDRPEHPVDVVERIAALNDWTFAREGDDEISIFVPGTWSGYEVSFTWLPDIEALHVGCAFPLSVPERKRAEASLLAQTINRQIWLGHFDVWFDDNLAMFRHTLCLAGGARATDAQCGAVVNAAIKSCENYYPAFQWVSWAGKTPDEALALAMFETKGAA